MRVFAICIIACLVLQTMAQGPVTAALIAAVTGNPEGFAAAAGTVAIDAVTVAGQIKTMIGSSAADVATIINLSEDGNCTWYTYNQVALVKAWTTYTSYLGPHGIIPVKSPGWGSMTTFCNNKGNPYQLERGGVYTWDGKSTMKMIVKVPERRMSISGMIKKAKDKAKKLKDKVVQKAGEFYDKMNPGQGRRLDEATFGKAITDAVIGDPEKWAKVAGTTA